MFTIVDMDKGYWQVVLHPESRKLTCMAFDIGRYQFKRLPMGSKVASDIFQRMLDSVYIGLPGVTGIADDMVIFGRNEEEHDRNLILFLETTRKNGLVLNKRKLQFKKEEVSFFGQRWSSTGISPDPKKTESILKMQFPPDKETMHSFLGLVNFLNRYTPKLAELCSPLRKLILKDSHYSPGDPEHTAFDAIKAEFKKKIILPLIETRKLFYKLMRVRKALEQLFYKKNSLSTMLRGHSHLQRRITRILNMRLKQQFGAWRNSTIFSMVESLFYKLIRNL